MDEVREEPQLREEWSVVDESCNCRRNSHRRDVAERVRDSGQLMPNRPTKGPLHIERRWVTDWERV